jgi:glucose/arabinose dehydrogenase/mono/diheme cytochrome c family protein
VTGRELALRVLIGEVYLGIALLASRWLTAHFEIGWLWKALYTRMATEEFLLLCAIHLGIGLPVLTLMERARREDAFGSFRRGADLVFALALASFASALVWFFLTQITYRPLFTVSVALCSALLASLVTALLAHTRDTRWTDILLYPVRSPLPWLAALFAGLCVGSALLYKRHPPFRLATNAVRLTLHTAGTSPSWVTRDFSGGVKLRQPMQIVEHPEIDSIYLVLEREGAIVALDARAPGSKRRLLHLGERLLIDAHAENGALGLALAPPHCRSAPGALEAYVYATAIRERAQYNTLLALSLDGPDPQLRTLIEILHHPESRMHNGGGLVFDDDCFLYLGIGDGTNGNDELGNSQRIDRSFYSGILRIDPLRRGGSVSKPIKRQPVDGRTAGYFIPLDNPFVGGGGLEEFWAIGLRNPYRIAFDAETKALWVGDVGQDDWEEINLARRGTNHQWAYAEGIQPFPRSPLGGRPPQSLLGVESPPWFAYPHRALDRSVIGGVVYRGQRHEPLQGQYVFADNYSGVISTIDTRVGPPRRVEVGRVGRLAEAGISSLTVDRAGRLLITLLGSPGREDGGVVELVPAAEGAPTRLAQVGAAPRGRQAFEDLCSRCHGADGSANTPEARAFTPPPRNLQDPAWHARVSDDEIAAVIRDGGPARGMSGSMPGWSSVLSEREIRELVRVIRAFARS